MQPANDNQPRLMSMKDTTATTSMSRTLISALVESGDFPPPIRLGARRWAFVRAEVDDWIDRRIAARSAS